MMLTLNPGFLLLGAAFLILALPRSWRPAFMALAAILAGFVLLGRDFGAADAVDQMGLPIVFLSLDALNRIFGIALLIVLVTTAIHSGARHSAAEDAGILLLAGGALSSLFVGDWFSFVAAVALAGLAGAWVVITSPLPGASAAGSRLLIWVGLEGLLFVVGVALHLMSGPAASILAPLEAGTIEGGFIFTAILIRAAAPLAHVWFKDIVAHASPTGAAALASFSTLAGVYALARVFPAEPILIPIGSAMIVLCAFYAAAEDDLRRAAAYALLAQTGICIALIGVGSPLALAAAEGNAFAATLAFAAYLQILGAVVARTGSARLSDMRGLSRSMPVTMLLLIGAGLAASAPPGTALYATHATAREAVANWELRAVWALVMSVPPVMLAAFVLRPALQAYAPSAPAVRNEGAFAMLLGGGLALFFSYAVGVIPRWLYGLMTAGLQFNPFEGPSWFLQLETLGAAGLIYLLLSMWRFARVEGRIRLLDVDAFYRGPLAAAGRVVGGAALSAYKAAQSAGARMQSATARALSRRTKTWDRPFDLRLLPAMQFLAFGVVIFVMLFSASQQ
jgi:multicomponent Na+:H+ antiporter subunit D